MSVWLPSVADNDEFFVQEIGAYVEMVFRRAVNNDTGRARLDIKCGDIQIAVLARLDNVEGDDGDLFAGTVLLDPTLFDGVERSLAKQRLRVWCSPDRWHTRSDGSAFGFRLTPFLAAVMLTVLTTATSTLIGLGDIHERGQVLFRVQNVTANGDEVPQ